MDQTMIELLAEHPILLLFVVAGLGYALGQIRVKGVRLGVAAVLFVGLGIGALDPRLTLPPIIFELGLVIFVYSIGISSGAGFFASLRGQGLRNNLFILLMLILAALLTAVAHHLLSLRATVSAGLFAGSFTNTPALASVLESIATAAPPALRDAMLTEPVVGYSVAYPMGVIGMILAVLLLQTIWKIDYVAEARALRSLHLVEQELYNRTILVTQAGATAVPLRDLRHQYSWDVVFGRIKRGDEISLATGDTRLQSGDLISIVGAPEDVDALIPAIGELTDEHLELDRSLYDYRRMFVSNPAIAGRSLAELRLPQRYGALVTRVRRGDIDLLAHGDLVLELGDRVRVLSRRKDLSELSHLFGDSYKDLSEVNLISLGVGLALGLLLGSVPIPLPGGITFKLGAAGGPLIVGLILGALRRTGPIVWTLPYSANLTLRQIGLIFLLAGIGLRSGYTFLTTFAASGGFALFLAGAVITVTIALLTLIIGYKLLHIPFALLVGMLSALQTQPAVLSFGQDQAGNDLPNVGYALVFPVATISKILFAQLLLTLLS
jgi:putative transport protein